MYLIILHRKHRVHKALIESHFEQRGLPYRLLLWRGKPQHIALFLRTQQAQQPLLAVLAGGGDGTISAVINQVAAHGLPIGILPLGTGNLLAKSLTIPQGLSEALTLITDGTPSTRSISTLETPERRVSLILTTGIHAQNLRDNHGWLKKYLGMLSYIAYELRGFLRPKAYSAEIRIDGQAPLSTSFSDLVLTNTSVSIIPGLSFAPDTHPTEQSWTLCVLQRPGFWESVHNYFLLRKRRFRELHGTQYYRFYERIEIRMSRKLCYMIDGERCRSRSNMITATVDPTSHAIFTPHE